METRAVPETRDGVDGWLINGEKMWTTGSTSPPIAWCSRGTSGKDGQPKGISCFLVPDRCRRLEIGEYLWTFNMPTDHPKVSLRMSGFPPMPSLARSSAGSPGPGFVHENRIRQAASSLGAAQYCIE